MPAIRPYPEPDKSSMCLHPTSWRTILLVSSHPSLGLPSSLFLSGFATKTSYAQLLTPYELHARPSHSSRFDKPNNIWPGIQISKLLIMRFLHFPVTLSPLGPNILLSTVFSSTPSLRSSLSGSDQVAHPKKTTSKRKFLYLLMLTILDIKMEGKRLCT